MKKLLVLALSLILAGGLVSCGGGKQVKDSRKKSGSGTTAPANRGQATGYATIFDNDMALARDRATDDAKSKLVRQVLGETIQGQSIMKDFELVSNIVEAKSIGLVKNDRIIKQWQENTEYFVTIEGTVEPTAVEDAIADILNTYGRPKFMVLIKENFEGKQNSPGFTETEMVIQEIMGNSGFEFVDAAMTQKLMQRDRQSMNNAMDGKIGDTEQQLLLNDAGAEVIIIGTADTQDQSKALSAYGTTNMRSKSAIVRLKAIDVYTGSIVAAMSRNARECTSTTTPHPRRQSKTSSSRCLARLTPIRTSSGGAPSWRPSPASSSRPPHSARSTCSYLAWTSATSPSSGTTCPRGSAA
jgi:hypothetical protein